MCGKETKGTMSAREMAKRFTPVVHHEDGSYWAEIPAMPGCLTVADTVEELATKLMEAMTCWLLTAEDAKRFRPGCKPPSRRHVRKMAMA